MSRRDGVSLIPRITVHVPCFNYGRFLGEALNSLLEQSFVDWEAIVVDDASTDDTREIAAEFRDSRIRVVTHDQNAGNIATYNEAILLARGDLFCILSADDRYKPRFLERTLAVFESDPAVGLVYTNYERIAPVDVSPWKPPMPHAADGIFEELPTLLERPYIAGCAVVTRTSTLRDLGGYDSRFPHTADTYL